MDQAEYHYRGTIFHERGYALAFFDYDVTSVGVRSQFETAVRLDTKLAEAHVGLPDMFALQGTTSRSVSHYQQALALNADLGYALVSSDKRSEEVHHLEMATQSNEPGIRSAA